jgi:hypothetical protein
MSMRSFLVFLSLERGFIRHSVEDFTAKACAELVEARKERKENQ